MVTGGIVFEASINSMVFIIIVKYTNRILCVEFYSQVLELTALLDDIAELNETYYVHLTEVIGGGRLASDNTTANVTILANQNPYGVFELTVEGV